MDGRLGGGEAGAFCFEGNDDVVGDVEDGSQRVADGAVSEGVDGLVGDLPLEGHEAGGVDDDDVGFGAAEAAEVVDVVAGVYDAEGDGAAGLLDLVGPFDAGALGVY